eukprot:Sspe_Gene.49917::Locus_27302_Transcript_1_1_Confidence_1.000_Length_830::g.49917::m.49917
MARGKVKATRESLRQGYQCPQQSTHLVRMGGEPRGMGRVHGCTSILFPGGWCSAKVDELPSPARGGGGGRRRRPSARLPAASKRKGGSHTSLLIQRYPDDVLLFPSPNSLLLSPSTLGSCTGERYWDHVGSCGIM